MNGAGPPDRAQLLDLSTLQGRTRAQMPSLVLVFVRCAGPARWSDNLRRTNLVRLSREKAKHQRPQEVT